MTTSKASPKAIRSRGGRQANNSSPALREFLDYLDLCDDPSAYLRYSCSSRGMVAVVETWRLQHVQRWRRVRTAAHGPLLTIGPPLLNLKAMFTIRTRKALYIYRYGCTTRYDKSLQMTAADGCSSETHPGTAALCRHRTWAELRGAAMILSHGDAASFLSPFSCRV